MSRAYFYLIYNREAWHPHWVNRSGFYYRPLALVAMQEAALALIGRHDFSAFRAAECQAKSPIRTIQSLTIQAHPPFFMVQVKADGFLHHMIRNIVGALLAIGCGDAPVSKMRAWLQAGERSLLPPTFAASGLYFAGAQYPPELLSFPTLCSTEEILPGL
jgi:tRNA pseudouridine38-40 synthase